MKKIFTLTISAMLLIGLIFISHSIGLPQVSNSVIDKIRLLPEDIPQGFIYGLIPDIYKKTLKNNPWEFDKSAIEKLADKIYPGGDHRQISAIHVTIIARKETPHRDDIVCYIIQYRKSPSVKDELKKISEYAGYNQDRAILHIKDNYAVFLFVDDAKNFLLLQELDKKITERIEKS
jgi:hypothetical protein